MSKAHMLVSIPLTLPRRRQQILSRILRLFNSFGENIPRGLIEAIERLLALHLDVDDEIDQLECILNRWARLH